MHSQTEAASAFVLSLSPSKAPRPCSVLAVALMACSHQVVIVKSKVGKLSDIFDVVNIYAG
jgi:hypothetical protein